jgi:hypothetical protein
MGEWDDGGAKCEERRGAVHPGKESHRSSEIGGKGIKKKKKKKGSGFALTADELKAVFGRLAGSKVTIGATEFVDMVAQLDLDVGDDMGYAAWELVAQSGHAGACNRLDQQQFVAFVQQLARL